MKRRLAWVILLLAGFAALAIPTGAVPAVTAAGAAIEEAVGTPAVTARPGKTLYPETGGMTLPDETPAPIPLYEPEDAAEPPRTTGDGVRIAAVTIESEALLKNDTDREIDAAAVLEKGPSLTLPAEGYQVLIVHTHSTEAYAQTTEDPYEECGDCRTTDPEHSVIRVGKELADALSAYGLRVLHCTELFDWPDYNGAYARSGAAIEEALRAHPEIRVVIDLHRDALGDGETVYKTMANIDGVYAAQLMLVMGTDVNLEHPAWRENLALALTLQQAANERYGTLMRPAEISVCRYNQQLAPGGMLLEVGTSGNTLAEALCAVRLFAETAGPVLASYIQE